MKQVASLLEAVDSAVELYPSSCAAAADHPALFEPEVTNRLKVKYTWTSKPELKLIITSCPHTLDVPGLDNFL